MTTTRIGLMGFGRIGRNVMRLLHDRSDLDVVAISDIADPAALTYLLKYDSIYGRFPAPVSYTDGTLAYGEKKVAFLDAREPGGGEPGAARGPAPAVLPGFALAGNGAGADDPDGDGLDTAFDQVIANAESLNGSTTRARVATKPGRSRAARITRARTAASTAYGHSVLRGVTATANDREKAEPQRVVW